MFACFSAQIFQMNSVKRPVAEVIRICLRSAVERRLHLSASAMAPVKVGDNVPSVELYEDSPANKVNTADFRAKKKIVIFGVPGAFTPGCSKTHLPGYISSATRLKNSGVNDIFCVSINDPYVMGAWGRAHDATGKVRMLADPQGLFTKALDLTIDLPPLGGIRSKRYSMVVENGVITAINIEPDGTGLTCSLADSLVVAAGGI